MSLYFIALLLPKELQERIRKIKLEIAEKYEAKHALKLPAHITLQIPFKIPETQEPNLIDVLAAFAKKQQSFGIGLKDFGRFNQKVIFINIEDHEPLKRLHAEMRDVLSENFIFKKHETFSKIHPHITLATRNLHYKQFPKAWAEFQEREFSASFTPQEFSLLKHDGKTWHRYRDFPFIQ